jgi:RIO kinase 2
MSSAEVAAQVFRQLEIDDLRVLQVIETGMSKREYVQEEQILSYTKLSPDKVKFVLKRLHKMGLIYQKQGGYVGHTLNYTGYDCLAINALVKTGAIDALGRPLGIGKEADVLDALNPSGDRVAIKFHRLGRISFRQTRRKRDYLTEHAAWLFQSRLAAEKEFQALNLAYNAGVAVPKPIKQNRHVIVMEIIEGVELSKAKEIDSPEKILNQILSNIRKTYRKAGLVHGDLSEYNIILKPNNHILIIDWPQAVKITHPSAQQLLTRDIKNVTKYFRRKYLTKTKIAEAMDYVTGKPRKIKSKVA